MTRVAVLFDMDGTLVDSEPAHFEAMAEVLRLHGHAVPEGLAGMVTGMTGADCHALLGRLSGFKPSFEDYVRDKYGFYLAAASELAMRPGAQAALDALQDGAIPWAIVSNSDRMLVDANLRAVGLQRPGLVSVSRNDVRDGKPEAEPYLRAAYLLGLAPSDCIVVGTACPARSPDLRRA
ncbi:HAD family hydrolase [Rhizobium sp. GN54]|uniref:HAD family hydrolase n=1 Tax=Rhizobium sp. GN54 TaxID=2898150 RepID=UPI001E2883DD|nr:HAD family phosphatase [Rhizobium sp. GN54]MCD2182902.1 HAD family phosphatase [Rhizobium sp. GN54]